MRKSLDPPDRASAIRRGALLAIVLAPALHAFRFGYRYGASDQDEFLPWLLTRLEPGYFSGDWLVGVQAGSFNVRTGFVRLLTPLAETTSPESAALILFVAAWVLLAWAVYDVTLRFSGAPLPAVAATVLVLAVIPRWTLGGNALASSMLVPSLAAWAIGLSAMALYLRGRPVLAGIAVGAAAGLQFLVAFHVGLAILVGALVAWPGLKRVLAYALPAIVLSAPTLFMLADAGMPVTASAGEAPLFAIMAYFRAPHHYAAAAFPQGDLIRVGALSVVGLALLLSPRTDLPSPVDRFGRGLVGLAAVACLVGWIGTEILPSVQVAVLQPFQHTLVSALVFVAVIMGRLFHRAAARFDRPAEWTPSWRLVFLLCLVGASLLFLRPVRREIPGTIPAVATWAQSETTRDAVFAVPPSTTGFSYQSRRSVLVTFKAWAFAEADMRAWLRRMQDVAPNAAVVPARLPPGARLGPAALLARLDDDWDRRSLEDLSEIARRYGVTYFVRRRSLAYAEPRFSLAAEIDGYRIYRWNGAPPPLGLPPPADSSGTAGTAPFAAQESLDPTRTDLP